MHILYYGVTSKYRRRNIKNTMCNLFTNGLTNYANNTVTTQNGNGTWLYGGTYQASVYVRLTAASGTGCNSNCNSNGATNGTGNGCYHGCGCCRRRCYCYNNCGCYGGSATSDTNTTNVWTNGCARQYGCGYSGYNRSSCGYGYNNYNS